MPVLVQNLQAGPTVLSDMKDLHLEWQGKGDPNGGDVLDVPDEVLKRVEFVRAVRKGIFKVIDPSEEVQALLAQQDAASRARAAAAEANALAAIDPEVNKDLVSVPCIGPANRGTGTCGEPVPVREKKINDAPALCSRHVSLADQYLQIETGEVKEVGDKIVPVTRWVRATVGAREKQEG